MTVVETSKTEEVYVLEEPTPHTPRGFGSMRVPRLPMYVLAWLLTFLTSGGLTYGFGPVYSRLVKEKQWHDLCPPNTTLVCSEQEVQLQSIYSTGILMTVLGQAVFGTLLDTIGPRYMTLIAYLFSIAGNVCMAYGDSASGTEILLVIGYALIGFGGMGILYASLQLSMLFREHELYTALLVAALSCSGYVYVFLQLDIPRETFYLSYTGVFVAAIVIVYLVYPVHHIVGENTAVITPGFQFIRPTVNKSKMKNIWAGAKTSFKRKDLWAYITMGALVYLILVFGGGAIPNVVASLNKDNDPSVKDHYTNYLYPLVSNLSFIFSPFGGMVMLRYGFRATAYLTVVTFLLLCGSFMIPSLPAQNLTFVLMAASNGFFGCIQFGYIMTCFPPELYGVLSGVATLLVFGYCTLSYALTPLAQYGFDGNNNYVFLILICTTVLASFLIRFLRESDEIAESDLQLGLLDEQHLQSSDTPSDEDPRPHFSPNRI
ncbi:hypothetical protein LEN26_001033 [Aphanomyces euteiches]|nr:hypothetical protein AeMF1_015025 [Aphanomyces euteiches]KAH9162232.1 hypothetical protein LEN26_001033 [Aphanomyces euteiches]KAH9191014.1 hypothetical protein AeNC1_007020 [Aphanomyces euteiches]